MLIQTNHFVIQEREAICGLPSLRDQDPNHPLYIELFFAINRHLRKKAIITGRVINGIRAYALTR